jgi:3',5'-cyclic AMP phosphodiesterase CpdA
VVSGVRTRILHLSDLHAGTREDALVGPALAELVAATAPDLVVASGDLTHRGRRDQHARAADLLRSLGPPVLAVPGNHDIPALPPARLTRTFDEFERQWGTTEPVHRSDRLVVVGLNSVRPWLYQEGLLRSRQLAWAAEQLAGSPPGALRAVVLHHHLLGAPWRSSKLPVARRNRVLAALVDSGAELVLAGHIHQAAVSERREFEVSRPGGERGVTISIAPGLGQPRPSRRGEARGLHVYDVAADRIEVRTHIWRGTGWALTAERRFPRGSGALRRTEPPDEQGEEPRAQRGDGVAPEAEPVEQ